MLISIFGDLHVPLPPLDKNLFFRYNDIKSGARRVWGKDSISRQEKV